MSRPSPIVRILIRQARTEKSDKVLNLFIRSTMFAQRSARRNQRRRK